MSVGLKKLRGLAFLAACVFGADLPKPYFTVRERLTTPATVACPEGRLVVNRLYSEITVFDDAQVTRIVWVIPACSDPAQDRGWTVPPLAMRRRSTLSRGDYEQLQRFLDRPEVQAVRPFPNAGPGIGDYEIEIRRVSGVQSVGVVSLMPNHFELQRDPTLLELICKAKQIAGAPREPWCPGFR